MRATLTMTLLCWLALAPGCGDADTAGADAGAAEAGAVRVDEEIGKPCTAAPQCAAIPSGYCDPSDKTCTRFCDGHIQCGCAPGTAEADIAAGACRAACVFTLGVGHCFRACGDSKQCAPGTTCNPLAGTAIKICE